MDQRTTGPSNKIVASLMDITGRHPDAQTPDTSVYTSIIGVRTGLGSTPGRAQLQFQFAGHPERQLSQWKQHRRWFVGEHYRTVVTNGAKVD